MFSVKSFFGFFLLLSFAFLAPIDLPAGGSSRKRDFVTLDDCIGTIFIGKSCKLRAYPSMQENSLRTIDTGTPIHILRIWHDQSGSDWLHIQISSINAIEDIKLVNRGWIGV
tara:strand:+ start:141 stop:476 length:336 start_codon:yes stop_codon:yes gene_type:complete